MDEDGDDEEAEDDDDVGRSGDVARNGDAQRGASIADAMATSPLRGGILEARPRKSAEALRSLAVSMWLIRSAADALDARRSGVLRYASLMRFLVLTSSVLSWPVAHRTLPLSAVALEGRRIRPAARCGEDTMEPSE